MMNYKNLKEIRKRENLSAKEVSNRIGVSYNTLMNYESGLREPSIDTLLNLSKIYKVSIDYLISGQEFNITFKNEEIESFLKISNFLLNVFLNLNTKLSFKE